MSDCPFCQALTSGKNILYEDEKLVVVIPEKTVAKGHLRVIPKEHKVTLQEFDDKDTEHMFYAASFSATALFENLQAQGTNIIANTGGELNKTTHFHIDVIARWQEDKLNFLWTPKRMPEGDLDRIQGQIKDKTFMIGKEKKKKDVLDLDKKPETLGSGEEAPEPEKTESTEEKPSEEKKEETEQEENYLVRQLRRMP